MSEIPVLYGQYDDEGNPLWMDGAVRQMFALRAENARLRNLESAWLEAMRAENEHLQKALKQATEIMANDPKTASNDERWAVFSQCVATLAKASKSCETRAEAKK